ncbi:MAG TPA: hypothetical protein VK728_11350 [Candidatus Sulfotelmatobacter sp.]|jgi:hypothetical protein|nr:hypothetical protein [Candidatus Sulfotelmatobacter sp.]
MYRQESDNVQTLLAVEVQLLDMISSGAPLPQVLDRICTALDVQLGNVVSLVLFPDDGEHTLHTIAQSATQFGLTLFSCVAILSPSEAFLGTLETYCCFPRKPAFTENELIERAVRLAALAIQQYNYDVETESRSLDWLDATGKRPREEPPSSN